MGEPAKPEPRLLNEDEHTAILAATVQRETAELTTKVTGLEQEKAELQSRLDSAEAALETEKAARAAADQALEDHKAQVERDKEIAARRDERVARVREVAKHLKDDFFTEERKQRWAEMADDAFNAWVTETAALVGGTAPSSDGPPRETAMTGQPVTQPVDKGNLGALWGGKVKTGKEG